MQYSLQFLATLAIFLATSASWSLAAAESLSGTVLSPDGTPAADAEVIAATPRRNAYPNIPKRERILDQISAATATTDAAGHFTIAIPGKTGVISISHPKLGYAEVEPDTLRDASRVTLKPWCRVEGTVKFGGKPSAGCRVSLADFSWRHEPATTNYCCSVKTDANGAFAFDHVPAGVAGVYVYEPGHEASVLQRFTTYEPGQSVLQRFTTTAPDRPGRFEIGGTGRAVVAQFTPRQAADPSKNEKPLMYGHLSLKVPSFAFPDILGSAQKQYAADREWLQTPAAAEKYAARHEYAIVLPADGTLRVSDVPPGTYELKMRLDRDDERDGEVRKTVHVDEAPAGEPLDLGTFDIGDDGGL